jgi:hypothetical protein
MRRLGSYAFSLATPASITSRTLGTVTDVCGFVCVCGVCVWGGGGSLYVQDRENLADY